MATIDSIEVRISTELTKLKYLEYLLITLRNGQKYRKVDKKDNFSFSISEDDIEKIPCFLKSQDKRYPSVEHNSDGIWFLNTLVAKLPMTIESYQEVEQFLQHFMVAVPLSAELLHHYKTQITLALFDYLGLSFYKIVLEQFFTSSDMRSLITHYLGFQKKVLPYLDRLYFQKEFLDSIVRKGLRVVYFERNPVICYNQVYYDNKNMNVIKELLSNLKTNYLINWNQDYDDIIVRYLMNLK